VRSNAGTTIIFMIMMLATGIVHAELGDITFQREQGDASTQSTAPAVFPHWKHRIHYKCYACHNAIFQMKAGTAKITMQEISDGKYCGACHNGKQAWAVSFDTCNNCHKGE